MSEQLEAARQAVCAQLGEVRRTELGAISPLWARRFAAACGETDPIFYDDQAAAAAGWDGVPLPPLLLSAVRVWEAGPPLAEDGTPLDDLGFPDGFGLRALGGGQALRFHADALAGVDLHSEVEVRDATIKSGGGGPILIVELERRFAAADDTALLTCVETRILR